MIYKGTLAATETYPERQHYFAKEWVREIDSSGVHLVEGGKFYQVVCTDEELKVLLADIENAADAESELVS